MVDDGILGDDPEGLNGGEAKPEEEDLWAGTQGKLKMARPESVHYAKKAKKVDVKRLKDNIWKGLKIEDKAVGLQDDMVSYTYNRQTGAVKSRLKPELISLRSLTARHGRLGR
jgi:hypothetical protein